MVKIMQKTRMSRLSEYLCDLAESCEIQIASFTLCWWSGLLPSCGRLARISFLSLLEIDEFRGFPAFSLLFWHERFLLCRISHLQVDLRKKKTISILLHMFNCI